MLAFQRKKQALLLFFRHAEVTFIGAMILGRDKLSSPGFFGKTILWRQTKALVPLPWIAQRIINVVNDPSQNFFCLTPKS